MKRPKIRGDHDRFKGQLRHYHRSGPPSQQPWGEWGEGQKNTFPPTTKWLKIALITLSLLALGGIIIGLIVELR